jgi:predicted DNA-binding transcriptional regulator AlpA
MDDELIKLEDIIGSKKKGVKGLFPMSRSAWFDGVKKGRFPRPVHLSARNTMYFKSDMAALIQKLKSER